MPALDSVLQERIKNLEQKQQLRTLRDVRRLTGAKVLRGGRELLSFSCNDYLGLTHHPEVIVAAQEATARYGAGAGASRLVTGNHPLYAELEAALALHKGTEAACVFGSGYLANLGTIAALVGKGDLILADKLVHACMLDGAALSGAKLLRFRHNDAEDCARLLELHRGAYANCLVLTETVFSMDGDRAPVAALRALCETHDAWLMTDDAHGLAEDGNGAQVQLGTLSKALASYGGYVCGSAALVSYLQSAARSLVFTTALPPAALATSLTALRIARKNPEICRKALENARFFAQEMGLREPESAIIPLIIGEESAALSAAKRLEEAGFLVAAIRPPTVPVGTARLRFAFSAEHTEEEIRRLAQAVTQVVRPLGTG